MNQIITIKFLRHSGMFVAGIHMYDEYEISGLNHLQDRFRPTIHLTWARRNDGIKNIKTGDTQ